jgi:hypothetical protein
VAATQINDLTLEEVSTRLNLARSHEPSFFQEWQGQLPAINPEAVQELQQIQADYEYLSRKVMDEGSVKLVVVGRLLGLAGFYQPPFSLVTEKTVKLKAAEGSQVLRGVVDILAMHEKVWVLLVEAKRNAFSIEPAIPQALAYMSGAPYPQYPTFGLVTNGLNFVFLKLSGQTYGLSRDFSLRNPGELNTVLQVMRHLGEIVRYWGIIKS